MQPVGVADRELAHAGRRQRAAELAGDGDEIRLPVLDRGDLRLGVGTHLDHDLVGEAVRSCLL